MIIESLLGVGGTILAAYIWEAHIHNRVSIHRVLTPNDRDADALLDLYESLFPDDGTNYAIDEILLVLDASPGFSEDRHVRAENIVLTARCRNDVIGFLICHFYPERRKAIVTYYGIKKEIVEARRLAAGKLLQRLKRVLLDGSHTCDFVFFDLQGVDATTPKKESGERKARPVRFRQSINRLGLKAYILQFPYACPKISLSHDTREYPFSLMCVPVSGCLQTPVPRAVILEFLNFLFHDCYGDLYPVSDERFQQYHDHLQQCVKHYEDTLPPEVQVV